VRGCSSLLDTAFFPVHCAERPRLAPMRRTGRPTGFSHPLPPRRYGILTERHEVPMSSLELCPFGDTTWVAPERPWCNAPHGVPLQRGHTMIAPCTGPDVPSMFAAFRDAAACGGGRILSPVISRLGRAQQRVDPRAIRGAHRPPGATAFVRWSI
jgi:hypothetical protein